MESIPFPCINDTFIHESCVNVSLFHVFRVGSELCNLPVKIVVLVMSREKKKQEVCFQEDKKQIKISV